MFIKGVLNWCKLQIRFKDHFPQILTSGVVYNFPCGLCNEFHHGEFIRHLVTKGEHISISFLTSGRLQQGKDIAACHHLLNFNYLPTFEDFSVLRQMNKEYILKLNESLFITQSIKTFVPFLSIYFNGFLPYYLLHSVTFCDQFFHYFYIPV